MNRLRLGYRTGTRSPVDIPVETFQTHFHLIGGTGKGKTTAIHTMLHPLLMNPYERACFIIVDRHG